VDPIISISTSLFSNESESICALRLAMLVREIMVGCGMFCISFSAMFI